MDSIQINSFEKNYVNNNRIVYFCQISICFTIILTSIICMSMGIKIDNFFPALLGSVIGYILPSPKIKNIKINNIQNIHHNTDNTDNDHTSVNSNIWTIFGYKFPKSEIVYFCQIIICYIIIFVSLSCLAIGKPSKNDYLFTLLTTSTLGYILPNPKLKNKK